MANTEIDSLSLNISINGLSDKDIKNLESLSNSIAKLQRSLRKLEIDKLMDIKIPTSLKGISGVDYQLMPTQEMADEFEKAFEGVEETFNQIDTSKLDDAEKSISKINTEVKKIKTNSKDVLGDLGKKDTSKRVGKTKNQLNSMEKTLKRIKLISFIKLIRGAINSLIKGVQSGINNLALFDSSFNDTMSELSTAKTQIFNSLGLIASPLIQIFQPIVTTLSNSLVNIANTVSLITAQIKGASTYTKINVDYMEDYAKSLQKAKGFAFDTFNALDTQDSMYETASVDDKEVEKTGEMYDIVRGLYETFMVLKDFAVDFFKTIGQFISNNKESIKKIIEQSLQFTKMFSDTGKFSQFETLFTTIATDLIPFIVDNVGVLLESIENISETLKPLMAMLGNKVLVNLLKLTLTTLEPISAILEYVVNPIIEEIVGLIVDVLTPILSIIGDIIRYMWVVLQPIINALKWIIQYFGGAITGLLKAIFTLLNPILTLITDLSGVFEGIVDMIEGIFTLDFDKFFEGFMKVMMRFMLGIARFFATIIDSIVNFFMEAIDAIIGNDAIKTIVNWFGADYQGITWRSNLASQIPTYAQGGMIGELWQMNEKGNPEMLYNPYNNGNTSVINIEQLASAFERAIINTGLLSAIEDGRVVYIDGKYVAQSRNFKNELNRTNPNLNIK